jgi:type II secretory pathway pseudopilin PulG
MKKNRYFFLLEIVVALGLLSLILLALFSFYVQFSRAEHKLELVRTEMIPLQQMRVRLNQLFGALLPPQGQASTFHTDGEALIFVFDNGVDPEPIFSGAIRGKLYRNGSEQFVFEQSPIGEGTQPLRREILSSKVERMEFQFFHVKRLYNDARGEWQTEWPSKQHELPPMVRLSLKRADKEEEKFAFLVPTAGLMATYK